MGRSLIPKATPLVKVLYFDYKLKVIQSLFIINKGICIFQFRFESKPGILDFRKHKMMRKIILLLFLLFSFEVTNAQDYASVDFSERVIQSFSQGDKASFNISAISLLKCSIATFGLNDVFNKTEVSTEGWKITLRNNEIINLSQEDLFYVKYKCGFKLSGDEQIFDRAILLYAVMAERTIHSNNIIFKSCHNLSKAVLFLHAPTNRLHVTDLVGLLGLDYVKVQPRTEICYVHQNGLKPVFACYDVFDKDGKKHKLDNSTKVSTENPDFILANFLPPIAAMIHHR